MLQPHNITNSLANDGDGGFFNPNKDPFQVSLDGRITKKPSTFLNADIAKYYYYSASVTDIYNENQSSSFAIMRIEIQDDTLPTLTLNHPTDNFIIESALTSNFVVQDSHGDSSQGSISTFARSTVNNVAENVNWIVNTVPPNLIAGAVDVTGTTTPNLLTSSLISKICFSNEIIFFEISETWLIILIGVVYLLGVQGITISIHIPLNNHLQQVNIDELNEDFLGHKNYHFLGYLH